MTERKQKRGHEEMVSVLLSQAVTKVAKAIPHAVDLGHTVSVNELNEIILRMQGMVARFTAPTNGTLGVERNLTNEVLAMADQELKGMAEPRLDVMAKE